MLVTTCRGRRLPPTLGNLAPQRLWPEALEKSRRFAAYGAKGSARTATRTGERTERPLPSAPMPTIADLANELGVSVHALKRRIALLRALGVDGCARDGAHGALVVSPKTAEVLRRALALEREGATMREALLRALGGAHDGAHHEAEPSPDHAPVSAPRSAPWDWALVAGVWAAAAALWAIVAILARG